MAEEKSPKFGFKIKWADREVEYYGESVKEVFEDVFEYVKSIPISTVMPTPSTKELKVEHKSPLESQKTSVQGTEYDRLARDSGLTKEQVAKVIEFKNTPAYDTLVPFLPNEPRIQTPKKSIFSQPVR